MANFLERLLAGSAQDSVQLTTALPMEILSYYLGQSSQHQGPQLVVTETYAQAERFCQSLSFWTHRPSVILPSFEPSLYSDVLLSPRQVHQRLHWLYWALNDNENHVFVAPIMGLCQKTIPGDTFMDHCMELRVGDELPSDFFTYLRNIGYQPQALVEDPGTFSNRGALVDIYSAQMPHPLRIELFDTMIESLRYFDQNNQRSLGPVEQLTIVPAREVLLTEKNTLAVSQQLLQLNQPGLEAMVNDLRRGEYSENLEYYLPLFYQSPASPLDYFPKPPQTWILDELSVESQRQSSMDQMVQLDRQLRHPLRPHEIYFSWPDIKQKLGRQVSLQRLNIIESAQEMNQNDIRIKVTSFAAPKNTKVQQQLAQFCEQIRSLPAETIKLVAIKGRPQFERIKTLLEPMGFQCRIENGPVDINELRQQGQTKTVYFYIHKSSQSFYLPTENVALFSFDHFLSFGKEATRSKKQDSIERAKHLSFGELQEGDHVIHSIHGVAQFKGLKKMPVAGIEAEFIELEFKDKDKLFLPIYRIHQIHKYTAEKVAPQLDKLGGTRFANVKTKTKKRLREIAHDLVRLYAERSKVQRPPYNLDSPDISDFFNAFPYQETEDQLSAMEDIVADLKSSKPMDRLICGDVGFGKTEIAMRAAFIVAHNRRQVALLAPTTVLTMQHYETLKNRFKDWPLSIEVVNRLQPTKKVKEILKKTSDGEVDIIIGTHRLLSQDVSFNDLGLLIVDEEQKFGVKHKEKIRKLKTNVDTVSLSATPIPRTLNMSLLKMRDLSLINTAPVDRLAVRTLICRYDKEIIKRAVETELSRGGQVFFLHNRVQSIYSVAEELRSLLPGVPVGVGHGQLKEKDLESVMVSFFNNESKVLVASSIIESGVDIPNANTIFINKADTLGLSQLYQLRGRVGRSGRRAYCYLLTEPNKVLSDISKERLKVIQENTKLGSGMQIAQYDLELRGAGTLLGEEQSGVIESMGYEYYMELLEQAIQEAQGQAYHESIEPDINLKIKAFIPSTYIANIRLRLSYYRALTQVKNPQDIDVLEEELKDQFGTPPAEVINLLGIMLIRRACIDLGVKDISSGKDSLVLSFTEHTPLPTKKVIELASQANKKYSVTPNNRLKIRMNEITWPRVYEEVSQLLAFCPRPQDIGASLTH
jgi:transcription-repair coupling factor (superfamily II helicase)